MDLHPEKNKPKGSYEETTPSSSEPIDTAEPDLVRRVLQENEEWYQRLFELAPVGIWWIETRTGRFLGVNPKFCEITGRTQEDLLGRTFHSITHPDDLATNTEKVREIAEGRARSCTFQKRYIRPDGTVRYVEVQVVAMGRSERPLRSLGIVQDVTERQRAQERLRECERVIEGLDEMILVVDRQYRYVIANRMYLNWRKVTREQVIGRSIPEMLDKSAWPLVKQKLDECFQGKVVLYRKKYTHPDLGERDLSVSYFPIESPAGVDRIAAILQDVTERQRAEKLLRESNERFRTIFENAGIGAALVDWQGHPVKSNSALQKMLGFTEDELRNMVFTQYTHPDDADLDWKLYNELVAGKRDKYEIEKRFIRKDGQLIWGQLAVSRVKNREGTPAEYMVALVEDVTDRKHAERALLESEERMRLAQEVAQIGTFDRNLVTGKARWSSEMEAMYGLPPGGVPKTIDAFLQLVHPDDRARAADLRARSMEYGAGQGEWRAIWPDGSVHWISSRWKVFRDAAGKPERLIGAAYDVTERKRIEEELRQAKEKLSEEKHYLEESIDTELGFGEIIGRSPALMAAMERVAKVASSNATVLLLGETGTGKELVARALHRMSRRRGENFIKVNCAAIPSGLLESELFGHEKGAFTGALARKVGRLELADGGTLFLDEIGDIPLSVQPKLLRALQEMEFERLGSTQTLKVNFRLIAATNRDLLQSMKAGQFRSDLYYRLNVFPVLLPPLRERRKDIPLLVEHFVRVFAKKMNKSITSIPKKTMEELVRWEWPGNIRELENFIERSVILTPGAVLQAPLSELQAAEQTGESLRDVNRERILQALRECGGRLGGPNGAAARLGLKRTTLQSRLDQLGIKPAEYRKSVSP